MLFFVLFYHYVTDLLMYFSSFISIDNFYLISLEVKSGKRKIIPKNLFVKYEIQMLPDFMIVFTILYK